MSTHSLADTTCRVNTDDAYYVPAHVTHRSNHRSKWESPYDEVLPGIPSYTPVEDQELTERVLGDYFARLPATVQCAQRLAYANRKPQRRDFAVSFDEIRPDDSKFIRDIRIDVDHSNALNIWKQVENLPTPSFAVINPSNNHGHLTWRLNHWVDRSNERAMSYLRDIRASLCEAIDGADSAYSGADMTHSPWSPRYRTTVLSDATYELKDFNPIRNAFKAPRWITRKDPKAYSGKNKFLFREGLSLARQMVRARKEADSQMEIRVRTHMVSCIPQAQEAFPHSNYRDSELRASVRSVMKYAARYYKERPWLRTDQTPEERRAYERDKKRTKRASKHDRAFYLSQHSERALRVAELRESGMKPAAISAELGLSLSHTYCLLKKSRLSVAPVDSVSLIEESESDDNFLIMSLSTGVILGRGSEESFEFEETKARISLDEALVTQDKIFRGEPIKKYEWLLNENVCPCGLTGDLIEKRKALLDLQAAREQTKARTLAIFHPESPTLLPVWKEHAPILRLPIPKSAELPSEMLVESEDWDEDPFAYVG